MWKPSENKNYIVRNNGLDLWPTVFITNRVFLLILLVILKIESVFSEFSTINFIIIFGLANEREGWTTWILNCSKKDTTLFSGPL